MRGCHWFAICACASLLAFVAVEAHSHPRGKLRYSPHNQQFRPAIQQTVNFEPFAEHCEMSVFMMWSTAADNFDLRYRRSLESVFLHMPKACVRFLTDSLTLDTFKQFTDAGYHVEVMSLADSYGELFAGTPLEAWYQKDRSSEPFIYTNLTNALRFAIVYRYGGIYLDTDVIVMRSLTGLRNVVGVEKGDVSHYERLNCAVMIFDKGSPVVHAMMENFVEHYDGYVWGQNGPRVVTDVARKTKQGPNTITVLPSTAFYPLFYEGLDRWFSVQKLSIPQQEAKLKEILASSYCVHYFNMFSHKYTPNKGTVMHHLFNDFCLFCDEVIENENYKTPAIGASHPKSVSNVDISP